MKKNLSGALGDISIWYKAALDRYKVFVVNEADRRVDLWACISQNGTVWLDRQQCSSMCRSVYSQQAAVESAAQTHSRSHFRWIMLIIVIRVHLISDRAFAFSERLALHTDLRSDWSGSCFISEAKLVQDPPTGTVIKIQSCCPKVDIDGDRQMRLYLESCQKSHCWFTVYVAHYEPKTISEFERTAASADHQLIYCQDEMVKEPAEPASNSYFLVGFKF